MAIVDVPLALDADQARDTSLNPSRLTNCYVEKVGQNDKAIVACDGFTSFATMTGGAAGQIRGMINLNDTTLYVVTGTRLQSVTTGGGVTHLQELATSGHAYMARNRRGSDGIGNPQIGIVTSDGLFRIIENNIVSTPTLDTNIPSTLFNSICHLDGYFIITLSNGEFYITSIDDGTKIDALDFASALSNPDGLLRGIVRGRELVLFGPRSTEWYQNTGATDFPFERAQSREMGIFCPAAAVSVVADIDGAVVDSIIWPATNSDGAYIGVMLMAGYDARKLSTTEVDRAITSETTPANIRAYQYTTADGTTFYSISGTSFSYEYNIRTKRWHRRTSSGLNRWRISDACQFNGKTIFGDYSSAALYQRSTDITPASASALTLRHSNDHGDTWTGIKSTTIGTSSQRTVRAKFTRLGMSEDHGKVLELSITNAIYENGTANDMTIITPPVEAWPGKAIVYELYVEMIPGGSLNSRPKGITRAKAIVGPVAA